MSPLLLGRLEMLLPEELVVLRLPPSMLQWPLLVELEVLDEPESSLMLEVLLDIIQILSQIHTHLVPSSPPHLLGKMVELPVSLEVVLLVEYFILEL